MSKSNDGPAPSRPRLDLAEFQADFIVSAHENLQAAEEGLLGLESRDPDMERVNEVFRAVHSLKGECAFMGYSRIKMVAHAVEDVLNAIRKNRMKSSTSICDLLLAGIDMLRRLVGETEKTAEATVDETPLMTALQECLNTDPAAPAAEPTPAAPAPTAIAPASSPAMEESFGELDMSEFLDESLAEIDEHMETLDTALLEFERNQSSLEHLNLIFRAAHTVKGIANYMKFTRLAAFTHQFENVVESLRSGRFVATRMTIDVLLSSLDILRALAVQLRAPTDMGVDEKPCLALLATLLQEDVVLSALPSLPPPIAAVPPAAPRTLVTPPAKPRSPLPDAKSLDPEDDDHDQSPDYLVVLIDSLRCGIPVARVLVVNCPLPICSLPYSADAVRGVVNLRGDIVPIVDLRIRFLFDDASEPNRIVVVEHRGSKVGLLVDDVDGIERIEESLISHSSFCEELSEDFVDGVACVQNRRIAIISLDAVLEQSICEDSLA